MLFERRTICLVFYLPILVHPRSLISLDLSLRTLVRVMTRLPTLEANHGFLLFFRSIDLISFSFALRSRFPSFLLPRLFLFLAIFFVLRDVFKIVIQITVELIIAALRIFGAVVIDDHPLVVSVVVADFLLVVSQHLLGLSVWVI